MNINANDIVALTERQKRQLTEEFGRKFNPDDFEAAFEEWQNIEPFPAGGNIFDDSTGISNEALFIMRWIAGMKMSEVLSVLKFDLNDSNLVQKLEEGNIGTAQRWAKTICGSDIEDDSEMMCGRYTKPPRIATFPNTEISAVNPPITKRVDITSVCSHHFLPYGTLLAEGSYAIISYVPEGFVLGISKLQRLADHVARRPTIQEDLTKNLWRKISEAAQTKNVYVALFNTKHTCEFLRGSRTNDGAFSSEYYDGVFNDPEVRKQVLSTVK